MGQKIKYMGSADVRTVPRGTDFGGQLAEPTESDLVFNADNNWVVDTDETNLSEEAVSLILEDEAFKDVSDLKRIPANGHQTTFLGMKASSEEEAARLSTASSTVSDTGTTTGGSTTGGTTGGSTAGGDTGGSSKAGKSGKST